MPCSQKSKGKGLPLLYFITSYFILATHFPFISPTHAMEPAVIQKMVESVSKRVFTSVGEIPKHILVVQNQKIDACVYPNRIVVITSGLSLLLDSEDELAFVLAHEVSHLKEEKGKEENFEKTQPQALSGEYHHGLKRELEADRRGIHFMKKAGYDPSAAVSILRKMPQHRDFSHRIAEIVRYLEGAPFQGEGEETAP